MLTRSYVLNIVYEAFADTPAPRPEEIAHCEQCELWVQRFLVKCPGSWQQIDSGDIAYESHALTAVNPPAYRFFLPAYLAWHLHNYDHSDSNTVDHLIYQLTRTESTDEHIVACYESLSRAQVRAVATFLTFVAGQTHDSTLATDAQKALSLYWDTRAA